MKKKFCDSFALAVGKVLSGVAIGFGVAIGMTILAIALNPILRRELLEHLGNGLLVILIPFILLLTFLVIIFCICRCSKCPKNHKKYYD